MVAASPNPSIGGLEVEGDPQLQNNFETSLRYIRHCLMWVLGGGGGLAVIFLLV